MSAIDDLKKLDAKRETNQAKRNLLRAEEVKLTKQSAKHLDEIVIPFEASWQKLQQVIRDPAQIDRMSTKHAAIATAFEAVARTAKDAGPGAEAHFHRVLELAQKDLEKLERAETHGSQEQASHDEDSAMDRVAILVVLCESLKNPGSAKKLVPLLKIRKFPQRAVHECWRLIVPSSHDQGSTDETDPAHIIRADIQATSGVDFVDEEAMLRTTSEEAAKLIPKQNLDPQPTAEVIVKLNDTEQSIVEATNRLWDNGLEWPSSNDISNEIISLSERIVRNHTGPMARHGILEKGPSGHGFKVCK